MRHITATGFKIIASTINKKIRLIENNPSQAKFIDLDTVSNMAYTLESEFYYSIPKFDGAKFLKSCFINTKFDGDFKNNR